MSENKELKAMTDAMFALRMNLAGHTSYSGTASKIDKGWAEFVIDRLAMLGMKVVVDENFKPQFGNQQAANRSASSYPYKFCP